MRVLMVHKKREGGVSIHVKEVSKELKKHGIEVDEITRNDDLGFKNFYSSYFEMKKAFKKLSKKYDIIHTHDWSIAYPAIKANVKNLISTFHAFPTNFIAKYFENYCINKLDKRAVVVSPIMKKNYKNSSYIPNGVNLGIFRKYKNVKRTKNLVGLAQNYNIDKIVNILQNLKMSFERTAGKWKYDDLGKFYSKIDIFISIPYKQAGFNMVWLEAMACEVPYVIGNNAGIGENLPIYKICNFQELEEVLVKIKKGCLEPIKYKRKWIVKNKLTWKAHVEKLVNLYKKVEK